MRKCPPGTCSANVSNTVRVYIFLGKKFLHDYCVILEEITALPYTAAPTRQGKLLWSLSPWINTRQHVKRRSGICGKNLLPKILDPHGIKFGIRDRYTIIKSSSTFIIVVCHWLFAQSEDCRRKASNSNLVPENSYTFVTFPWENCDLEYMVFRNSLLLLHHKIMLL